MCDCITFQVVDHVLRTQLHLQHLTFTVTEGDNNYSFTVYHFNHHVELI